MTEPDGAGGQPAGDTFRDPDQLIRRAGLRGDPEQDQHFLIDDRVLDRISTYLPEDADASPLLEIGAGTGALTDRLLAHGECVTVVERDRRLAAFLREEFVDAVDDGRLSILEGGALDATLPEFSACVSNLPYGISSEVAFRLLPEGRPLVLMFQREFAERMAADPGSDEYGRLSVSAQHYADVEVVESVPPTAFDPQPEVDSAVVRTTPREPEYTVEDEQFFLDLVKALFTQRRKTIRNGIRNTTHITGIDDAEAVVEAVDDDLLRRRAGKLTPAQFAELATAVAEVGRGGSGDGEREGG
jgi:16S rRNA (adenine1518-N6/adenine1519-N6)-dimethyltransferase